MVSAEIATRVSPGVFSLGTASFMGPFATEGGSTIDEAPVVAPPRGVRTRAADQFTSPLRGSRVALRPTTPAPGRLDGYIRAERISTPVMLNK